MVSIFRQTERLIVAESARRQKTGSLFPSTNLSFFRQLRAASAILVEAESEFSALWKKRTFVGKGQFVEETVAVLKLAELGMSVGDLTRQLDILSTSAES